MQLFKENTCLESRIGLNLLSTFNFQLSAFHCQLSIFVKPKFKVQNPKVKTKRTWADTKITWVIKLVLLWDSLLQV